MFTFGADEREDAERFGPESHLYETSERGLAEQEARDLWSALLQRDDRGEVYLLSRGLDAGELIARDVVRFDRATGDPAVALHHLVDGRTINVVRRRREPGDGPKVIGMRGCTTRGSLVGRVTEIDRDAADVVVITEGVIDTLAGVLAFPRFRVLGAHGAGAMPALVAAVVPRIIAVDGWLLLVPHADARDGVAGAGERAALAAARIAIDAGLVLKRTLRLVHLDGAKDLAEAWAHGWRWRWR